MISEICKTVDQKRSEVFQFIHEHEEVFARQGSVVESWRNFKGRRLGPYFKLTYRGNGCQRAIYLGSNATLAEEVRQMLVRLQTPLLELRHLKKQKAILKRLLAAARAAWDSELRKANLYLKGSEVRGWRQMRWEKVAAHHAGKIPRSADYEIEGNGQDG